MVLLEIACNCLLHHLDLCLVFTITFLLVAWFQNHAKSCKGLPPGPPAIPVFGSLPFLFYYNRNILEAFRALRRRYGDVYSVMLGSRRVVMLASYEAIYEALVKRGKAFQGRPQDLLFIKELTKGQGIVSSQGDHWQEQRQFAHNVFRDFGMGKSQMEDKLHEELVHFIAWMKESMDAPLDPRPFMQTAIANVVASIMFGKRHHYEEPRFKQHVAIMNKNSELVGQCGIVTIFPILRHIPGDPFGFNQIKGNGHITRANYNRSIDEHRQNHDASSENKDFIDAYLKQIDKNKKNPHTTFTDSQLMSVIQDLFGAGIETTTTTLLWALVYMLYHPEVLARCQEEVDSVIGPDRLPNMKDKVNMPYTEAVILEVQRMADIIPLGVPHCTMEDVNFRGHFIPKNTTVMVNSYCVHRDPDVWQEPDTFRPERFLGPDGKVEHNEKLIPFSLGKRVCMGQSLAIMELFLFFVTMIQHFDFELPAGDKLPDLFGILSMTKIPRRYLLNVKSRH